MIVVSHSNFSHDDIAELEYGVQRAKTPAKRHKRASALVRIKTKPFVMMKNSLGMCSAINRLALEAGLRANEIRTLTRVSFDLDTQPSP